MRGYAIVSIVVSALHLSIVYGASAKDTLNIAYLKKWPTPNLILKVDHSFGQELGVSVNWVAFDTGTQMSAAMQRGDIDIAYSQGVAPFVSAVSKGIPIKTIGIATSYAENDNCVVHHDAGITSDNAEELSGKKVAVPFGTVPHYKLLRQLEYLQVKAESVQLLDLSPAQGAEALANMEVSMACGFGGSFIEMLDHGQVLMSAQELADIGIHVFDIIAATENLIEEHPEWIVGFLQKTEEINKRFSNEPEDFYAIISEITQQGHAVTKQQLNSFIFPNKAEQLNRWFNGSVGIFYLGVADTFLKAGSIPEVLSHYEYTIDTSFLKKIR